MTREVGRWPYLSLHLHAGTFALLLLLGMLALFHLELALVFLNKHLKVGNRVEQLRPLLVVERHREAAQSLHADAALLTHAELYGAASLFRFYLLFQIG